MPRDIVYFDLETQRTANDAGGWARKGDMRMSVGVIFSTATGRYEVFGEAQVNRLIERLRRADLVIGFNVLNFDYQVLMGYTILDLVAELPTADLMADMEKRLGHRLGLDAIAHATLGIQKTAAGLDAIRWWREGRVLEIAEYCCFDVKVTRLVHEHGCRHKELFSTIASRESSASRSTGHTWRRSTSVSPVSLQLVNLHECHAGVRPSPAHHGRVISRRQRRGKNRRFAIVARREAGRADLGLLVRFPVVVARQRRARTESCNSSTGSCNAFGTPTAVSEGPIARTSTVRFCDPPTMNPPIITLSPVSTKPRVAMLPGFAGAD